MELLFWKKTLSLFVLANEYPLLNIELLTDSKTCRNFLTSLMSSFCFFGVSHNSVAFMVAVPAPLHIWTFLRPNVLRAMWHFTTRWAMSVTHDHDWNGDIILTCALGDGSDKHWWDGHEDASHSRHVRQDLSPSRRLAAEHSLEVYLHPTDYLSISSVGVSKASSYKLCCVKSYGYLAGNNNYSKVLRQ